MLPTECDAMVVHWHKQGFDPLDPEPDPIEDECFSLEFTGPAVSIVRYRDLECSTDMK